MKAMVVTPSLVLREREASPLKAQMPRNSATELSTTSFFLFILAHKGDIMGVNVQLEQSKHFHFHLNYENGKEKRSPLIQNYINKVWSISEQTLQGWLELEVGYAVVISPKKF